MLAKTERRDMQNPQIAPVGATQTRSWRQKRGGTRGALIQRLLARAVGAVLVAPEGLFHLRMAHGLAGLIGKQVLLRHVGDVFAFGVLGEQMVKWLVLARPDLGRNGVVPFLCVGE